MEPYGECSFCRSRLDFCRTLSYLSTHSLLVPNIRLSGKVGILLAFPGNSKVCCRVRKCPLLSKFFSPVTSNTSNKNHDETLPKQHENSSKHQSFFHCFSTVLEAPHVLIFDISSLCEYHFVKMLIAKAFVIPPTIRHHPKYRESGTSSISVKDFQ